jgi:glycosyltransferase involved in cell wall biosynthesis
MKPLSFFFFVAGMPFNGDSLGKKALGGSETMGLYMARGLAARGHNVTMFCNCEQPGIYEGVIYKNVSEFIKLAIDRDNPHDVTIVQRVPEPFTIPLASRVQFWWMHDLALKRYMQAVQGVAWNFDRILTVSEWHRQQMLAVYGLEPSIVVATRNGIDLDLIRSIPDPPERDMNALVFTARPERGMDTLLEHIFPALLRQKPELKIYLAGYENYVEQLAPLYNKIQMLVKRYEGRVRHLGGLSKPDLYRLYKSSAIYTYTTDFEEVSPVRGDSLIDTPGGKIAIKDLVGKTNFPVYAYDEENKCITIDYVCWVKRTRVNAKMITIRYKYGRGCKALHEQEITLTPDHEAMLRDGKYIQVGQLKPGDRIMPFNRNKAGGLYKKIDGTVVRSKTTRIHLNNGKVVSEPHFVLAWKLGRPLEPGEIPDHLDSNPANNDPNNLEVRKNHSEHRKAHVARMTDEQKIAIRQSISRGICILQERIGPVATHRLRSKAGQAAWKNKPRKQRPFCIDCGKVCSTRRCRHCHLAYANNIRWEGVRANFNHEVVSVTPASSADGYCMSMQKHKNFAVNGIIVHNCLTAMEVAACGLPFIASHRAALPETCIPEASILIPHDEKNRGALSPEYRDLFVDAVLKVLNDPGRWLAMSRAGIAGAVKYDWTGIAKEWEELAYQMLETESKSVTKMEPLVVQ